MCLFIAYQIHIYYKSNTYGNRKHTHFFFGIKLNKNKNLDNILKVYGI